MNRIEDMEPGVAVILADGAFPESKKALQFLHDASTIICCDGATVKLLKHELQPDYIVGDMDSLPEQYKRQFKDIITGSEDQLTNDLTKAVNKALSLGITQLVILGATGLREDHTLGNIGLLAEHGQKLHLQMVSDFGVFTALYGASELHSYPAQQVSIFKVNGDPVIYSKGLKFSLNGMRLLNLWNGTLNEALTDFFTLEFENGSVVVFRVF